VHGAVYTRRIIPSVYLVKIFMGVLIAIARILVIRRYSKLLQVELTLTQAELGSLEFI